MERCTRAQTLLVLVLGCWLLSSQFGGHAAAAEPAPCRAVSHAGNSYTACDVDVRRHVIKLFWKQASGTPYRYLRALPQSLNAPAARLVFATNAGMYHPDYRPVGLYVENGRELVRASTKSGPGNFHMKPNGIFFVLGDKAGILETSAYLKQQPRPDMATQSGPMLVIDGRLHPRFVRYGASRKPRTGVGVRDANTVVFVISDDAVSLEEFARMFRDSLHCRNALFLDGGSAANLSIPSRGRGGNFLPLGPMIAVYERTRAM
jgi:uncharacterized protein YigE (DUF2233 family)